MTTTCTRCQNEFETARANARYCPDCRPVVRHERAALAVRASREREKAERGKQPPDAETTELLRGSNMDYVPHRLDVLAAAIVGQAWRDARQRWQDGEYIDPATRADARAWWRENAKDWVDALGVDLALPEVEGMR